MSVWERTHVVDVGDADLHVGELGSGPPVLLLHGFPDSSETWRRVAPRLAAAGHRVIVPDQRGFGRSTAPRGLRAYGIGRIVDDAVAVLDALGVDRSVHVAGHDWGGMISWCLCLAQPERVSSHVALSIGHPRAYARAGLEQKRKGLYVGAFQVPGVAERWLNSRDQRRFRRWAGGHPDLDAAAADMARPGRLTAGLTWYRANAAQIFLRRWPACRVPTLGIFSAGDPYLAEDQLTGSQRFMAAAWRYERLPGGHWIPLEQSRAVAELIAGWAARHEPASAAAA